MKLKKWWVENNARKIFLKLQRCVWLKENFATFVARLKQQIF